MQDDRTSGRAVVVGIDGSRCAVDTAMCAVDEAVSRDNPLRLVYAIDPVCAGRGAQDAARELACAALNDAQICEQQHVL
ncbi:hypothetical protein ACGFK1_04470 [Mycobacterium sp. NPDC048908]|uniref:hypothetical protein n=1 Tax=Mycobacterium sp. NPDC048908 TaxID=3364292 RepID=UPI00371A6043